MGSPTIAHHIRASWHKIYNNHSRSAPFDVDSIDIGAALVASSKAISRPPSDIDSNGAATVLVASSSKAISCPQLDDESTGVALLAASSSKAIISLS